MLPSHHPLNLLVMPTRCALMLALLLQASLANAQVEPPEGTALAKGSTGSVTAVQERFFEEQIRPTLIEHCIECHGVDTQESDLRLDSRKAILRGGQTGPAVDLKMPRKSLLLAVIDHQGELKMPPSQKLTDRQIDAFRQWVDDGLPWPQNVASAITKEERYTTMRRTHWSFQPIALPQLKSEFHSDWAREPLDCLIEFEQRKQGVSPSKVADDRTLLRRVTFDLIGLPPDPSRVEAFLQSAAPDAYDREVDRLLASPHYGERWGRHWLDVARYADTKGYAFQRERRFPYAYTYRDYVIRAFNGDLAYDQFLREQLAADLLHEGDTDSLAALGFLTVGRRYNNVHDDRDDLIDVVTRGMLGLTVACARCHDHKYDAIPTEDYYSLYGVFASIHEPADLPLLSGAEDTPGFAEFKRRLDELTAEREALRRQMRDHLVETARSHATEYLVRAVTKLNDEQLKGLGYLSLTADQWRPQIVQRWRSYLLKNAKPEHALWGLLHTLFHVPDAKFAEQAPQIVTAWLEKEQGIAPGMINAELHAALEKQPVATKSDLGRLYGTLLEVTHSQAQADAPSSPGVKQIRDILYSAGGPHDIPLDQVQGIVNRADREKLTAATKKIDQHQATSPNAPARAMIVSDNPTPYRPYVFTRGNPARRGKAVERRFLFVLEGEDRKPFTNGSGRLELATAITEPGNPLTSRVIANRVWMHHFDQPLVTTPSDFGMQCERPRQLALLDYLAATLVERRWSLKTLHRRILASATYRQGSLSRRDMYALDPENQCFWRMNRRRLELEPLRDSMLAVTGNLDRRMGGRPVELTTSPFTRRRSVYGMVDRQHLPNLFRVFDFANPDQSSARRPDTTVPQQSLFMMNSQFVTRLSSQLVLSEPFVQMEDRQARIRFLYRRLFARQPTSEELEIGEAFVKLPAESLRESVFSRWHQYVQLLMSSNEFAFVD